MTALPHPQIEPRALVLIEIEKPWMLRKKIRGVDDARQWVESAKAVDSLVADARAGLALRIDGCLPIKDIVVIIVWAKVIHARQEGMRRLQRDGQSLQIRRQPLGIRSRNARMHQRVEQGEREKQGQQQPWTKLSPLEPASSLCARR